MAKQFSVIRLSDIEPAPRVPIPGRLKITTYRRHNCTRRHQTYRTAAQCVWPRAEWIEGRGPFAVLAYCRVLTVTLHQTTESAQRALALINDDACGGLCHNAHGIVQLHRSIAPGERQ